VSHMCNGLVRRVGLRIRLTYPQAASYRQTATSILHDFTWSLFAVLTCSLGPFLHCYYFLSSDSCTLLLQIEFAMSRRWPLCQYVFAFKLPPLKKSPRIHIYVGCATRLRYRVIFKSLYLIQKKYYNFNHI